MSDAAIALTGTMPSNVRLEWRADGGLRLTIDPLHEHSKATTLDPEQVTAIWKFISDGPPR